MKLDRPLNPISLCSLVQHLATSHAAKPRHFIVSGSDSKALTPSVVGSVLGDIMFKLYQATFKQHVVAMLPGNAD